jgi:hypothetical protein
MIQKTLEKIVNTAMWWLNLALIHYVVLAGFDLPKNFALKISIFLFELFFAYLVTIAMIYVTNSMKSRLLMIVGIISVLAFVLVPH